MAPFGKFSHLALPLVAACLLTPCATTFAQDSSSSSQQTQNVADAARRARERAKNATKPSKVITDDDLDKQGVKPGDQGLNVGSPPKLDSQPPNPDSVAAVESQDQAQESADKKLAKKGGLEKEIADTKEKLAKAEKEVDLLQRELALDKDTFYSNPNYQNDQPGKDKLDAQQQQINDKLPEIDNLKAHLAELKAELAKTDPAAAKALDADAPGAAAPDKPASPPQL